MGHETWFLVSILFVQLTAYPNSRVIPGAIQTLTFSGSKVESEGVFTEMPPRSQVELDHCPHQDCERSKELSMPGPAVHFSRRRLEADEAVGIRRLVEGQRQEMRALLSLPLASDKAFPLFWPLFFSFV